MDFIILGIGVGCWTYSFINHRYNSRPWLGSLAFFFAGFVIIIAAVILLFRTSI